MMLYEHDRTSEIVERLVSLGNITQLGTVAASVVVVGTLGLYGGWQLFDPVVGGLGALVGAGVGYAVGRYVSTWQTLLVEWMAQVLIAQGEILAALKRRR